MKTLKEIVLESVDIIDGKKKLTCTKIREIAKENNRNLDEISKICFDENIKIYKCELGCF